jgi:hypothetical protein
MLLTVRDESAAGAVQHELTLDVLSETTTVRELIRSRVYQEVDDHNRRVRASRGTAFKGLVTPAEPRWDAPQPRPAPVAREVDWQQQFTSACDAFERNGFFVLVDDRQVDSLDAPLTLRHDSVVSFVKLTPLVGG